MKKILFYFLFLAPVTFLLTSCEKDDPIVEVQTNSELILGTWNITAATIDPPSFTTGSDLYATYDDCDKDDLLTFESGDVVKRDEGATKCSASDPQTISGTYAFNPDETILTHTLDGTTVSSTITSIDATTMILVEKITVGVVENTLTFTFTKQ